MIVTLFQGTAVQVRVLLSSGILALEQTTRHVQLHVETELKQTQKPVMTGIVMLQTDAPIVSYNRTQIVL